MRRRLLQNATNRRNTKFSEAFILENTTFCSNTEYHMVIICTQNTAVSVTVATTSSIQQHAHFAFNCAIKTSCDTCSGVTWETTVVQFIAPVHRRFTVVVLHCLGVLSAVDVRYRRRGVSYVSSSTGSCATGS